MGKQFYILLKDIKRIVDVKQHWSFLDIFAVSRYETSVLFDDSVSVDRREHIVVYFILPEKTAFVVTGPSSNMKLGGIEKGINFWDDVQRVVFIFKEPVVVR